MMRKRWISGTILLSTMMIAGAPASAQGTGAAPVEPPSVSAVELKGKAPVNPRTLEVRLPRPQEAVLPNGLRIALLEDHKLPMFAMQWVIAGGGLADPEDRRGLMAATASLLREGAGERTSREIAEQLARLGSSLGASASPASGETVISVSGLREHFDATLDIAADVIRHPTFPQNEIDKYKSRFASQLQYQRSLPSFLAQEQFLRAVYDQHPASLVAPPLPVIQGLSREELTRHHARSFRPNNTIVLMYGDLTLKQAVSTIRRALGDWTPADAQLASAPQPKPPSKPRVVVVDRPGSVQTSLWLGALGIERKSEDYFAVLVMNHILGGGPASRLFMNLREQKGYTYGVSSSFTGSSFPGVMVANTDVRTEVTADALQELMRELQRIAAEPVSTQELANAKRALVGRFALSLESPQALLANLATQKIYGLPEDYWDQYPRRVEAITTADIQRVARAYLDPKRLQLVAVGDAAKLREPLSRYGEIEPPVAIP